MSVQGWAEAVPAVDLRPNGDCRGATRGKRRKGRGGLAANAEKQWDVDVPFGGSMVQVKRLAPSNLSF